MKESSRADYLPVACPLYVHDLCRLGAQEDDKAVLILLTATVPRASVGGRHDRQARHEDEGHYGHISEQFHQ